MPDQQDLQGKYQVRQEYENIAKTQFWAILSQEVARRRKTYSEGLEMSDLEIQSHLASKDQGRIDSLRWLVRVIKDIRDGKISLKTPSKVLEV